MSGALAVASGGQSSGGQPLTIQRCMYHLFPSVAVIILAEAAASFTGMVCFSQKELNTKMI